MGGEMRRGGAGGESLGKGDHTTPPNVYLLSHLHHSAAHCFPLPLFFFCPARPQIDQSTKHAPHLLGERDNHEAGGAVTSQVQKNKGQGKGEV